MSPGGGGCRSAAVNPGQRLPRRAPAGGLARARKPPAHLNQAIWPCLTVFARPSTPRLTPQEVIEFIFFPVVNEGCRVIAGGCRRGGGEGGRGEGGEGRGARRRGRAAAARAAAWARAFPRRARRSACPHLSNPPSPPTPPEGIVEKPADLDVATVMAMGFPPYRCVRGQGEGARGPRHSTTVRSRPKGARWRTRTPPRPFPRCRSSNAPAAPLTPALQTPQRRPHLLGRPRRRAPHRRVARGACGQVCARRRGRLLHALRLPSGGGAHRAQAVGGRGDQPHVSAAVPARAPGARSPAPRGPAGAGGGLAPRGGGRPPTGTTHVARRAPGRCPRRRSARRLAPLPRPKQLPRFAPPRTRGARTPARPRRRAARCPRPPGRGPARHARPRARAVPRRAEPR
jgi:hypothetical protein